MSAKTYVHDHTLAPFEQEVRVMEWYALYAGTNPKKLLKFNAYMMTVVPEVIANSMCRSIATSGDPVGHVKRCLSRVKQCALAIKELLDQGNHAMLMDQVTNEAYGAKLDTRENWLSDKTGKWAEDQEHAIIDRVLFNWMFENRRRTFFGTITMFVEFGFSGIPQAINFTLPDKAWEGFQELYRKFDETEELTELMALANAAQDASEKQ